MQQEMVFLHFEYYISSVRKQFEKAKEVQNKEVKKLQTRITLLCQCVGILMILVILCCALTISLKMHQQYSSQSVVKQKGCTDESIQSSIYKNQVDKYKSLLNKLYLNQECVNKTQLFSNRSTFLNLLNLSFKQSPSYRIQNNNIQKITSDNQSIITKSPIPNNATHFFSVQITKQNDYPIFIGLVGNLQSQNPTHISQSFFKCIQFDCQIHVEINRSHKEVIFYQNLIPISKKTIHDNMQYYVSIKMASKGDTLKVIQ